VVRIRRDKMIKELLYIIEESDDVWRKVAFYSDPQVQKILDDLYVRWGNSNYVGQPLELASDEELKILHYKATHLKQEDIDRAVINLYRKIAIPSTEESEEG